MPQPAMQPERDSVIVDPKHYRVEFENENVRVLRITYGPNEKSVMHGHPNAVAVFLTNARCRMTYPDGRTEDLELRAGQTMWNDALQHLPENITSSHFELVLVELKR